MAGKIEIVSPVDTAWLSMDEPTNLMMVNAIIVFDEPVSYTHLTLPTSDLV